MNLNWAAASEGATEEGGPTPASKKVGEGGGEKW